jgi:hypothetical protein
LQCIQKQFEPLGFDFDSRLTSIDGSYLEME